MGTLRVVVADDHEVVRKGLRSILEEQPGWEVTGEASDGREAVDKVKTLRPDVSVVMLGLPNDLHALSRPEARVELYGVKPPNGASRSVGRQRRGIRRAQVQSHRPCRQAGLRRREEGGVDQGHLVLVRN